MEQTQRAMVRIYFSDSITKEVTPYNAVLASVKPLKNGEIKTVLVAPTTGSTWEKVFVNLSALKKARASADLATETGQDLDPITLEPVEPAPSAQPATA